VEIDSEPLDPIPEIRIDSTERKGRKAERKSSDKKNPRTRSNETNTERSRKKKLEKKKSSGKNDEIRPIITERYRTIFDRGLIAIHPETKTREILFLGIIDNLTNYTISKQMANLFKSALWEADTLSTVPSTFYGDRFYKYLTTDLLGDEGDDDNPRISLIHTDESPLTDRPSSKGNTSLSVPMTKIHTASQPMIAVQMERPLTAERLNSAPQPSSPRENLTKNYERTKKEKKPCYYDDGTRIPHLQRKNQNPTRKPKTWS